MNDIFGWLQNWYQSQCDGEWEHEFGIKIETLDNPGWIITIDLKYTELENLVFDEEIIEKNDEDWFFYTIKDNKYTGSGDPSKLQILVLKFKEFVEKHAL